MRVKASQLVAMAVLGIAVPVAFAVPPKPVAHKAVAHAAAPKATPTKARHTPIPQKKSQLAHAAVPEKPLHKAAPIERRVEPARAPEPVPESDSVQVRHDRKQHFAPDAPKQSSKVAAPSAIVPVLYSKGGRLIMPPALKGSHEILVHQNEMADADGLDRVQDDEALDTLIETKELVPVPRVAGLVSDERLPENRRYCRPWTAAFLEALARAHYARFHSALQVNSAVRTVAFQQKLLTTNGNAAPAEGETASPHLTGQAVDLAKHGLSLAEIAWLRGYLLPLVQAGKVDVEEEFQQACFHISVYRKYVPEAAPKRVIAETKRGAGTALATAIR